MTSSSKLIRPSPHPPNIDFVTRSCFSAFLAEPAYDCIALKMVLSRAVLFMIPVCCFGFSWPKRLGAVDKLGGSIERPIQQYADGVRVFDDGGGNDDDDPGALLLNLDALHAYSRKPDCFKTAASSFRQKCSELDLDEESRVNVAISMTLCEIATAKHHSVPLECVSYSVDRAHDPAPSPQVQGECVDALARSAQFWSSYSGYLREVPQLCHAFRRWNDIDLARDIYYNTSVEKMAFIKLVAQKEKNSEKLTSEWIKRAWELQDLSLELKSLFQSYRSGLDDYNSQMRVEVDKTVKAMWDLNYGQFLQRQKADQNAIALLESNVVDVLQRHSVNLDTMLASIEVTVSHQLGNLFSQHEAALKQLDEAMHDTAAWWIEFGKSMHGMKQEVLGLSESAIQTSAMLGAAAREATDVRRLQHEASVAAGELVEALVQLTDTAHNELEAINGSAYVVKQHLQMRQISFQPWNTWLIKLLGLVHGADLDGVTEFEDLLSFRVMSSILGLSWIAVRTVLSGFISVAVMLFLVTLT
ncbi:hypothetical protein D9613_008634 [Agrocybe pediades]|uniref:Karyogamy protein 5 n=1 Tax=Agrocybe pediades TaxID=84607 RepID=A0A8H4VND1_9AGAR|nr:hypothetical protein D9613_008634 [Agrocybe pediades]